MTKPRRARLVFPLSMVAVALTACLSLGLVPHGAAEAQVSSLPIDFSDVVIFATNSVRIDNGAQVTSGHVVVNSASSGPTLSPGVELGINNNAHTPIGYAVVADSIKISNGAVVGGNAFFNTLSNSGTINGTQNTPLALPVFTPLPTFKSAPAGTVDVTVPNGAVQTLAAGNYRDIKVLNNATLRIDQGVTNVRSITVSNGGKLLFLNLTSGPSEVRVAEQMTIGNGFLVGPVDSDPLKAGKIVFYVASTSLMPVAVDTGNGGTLYANVYAPNGTLILDNGTTAVGAFLAKNVDVQNGSHVALESFFTQQPPVITSANSTTFTVLQSNSFTVTATGVPTPTITQSGTLPTGVNFMDNGNGTATLSGIPASGTVGTYPITFMATNAAGSTSQPFTLTVIKASQTISFTSTAPAGATVGGPTYNVTASATSGLAVSFTIDASASSVCTIAGSTVTFIGTGTCVINANQPGNANYNAAPQVQQSFTVAKGNQTITFTSTAPSDAVYQGPTYTVTATASSGLTVTFTIDASATSVCSIAGSTVSFIGAGTCVINANQAGNANYNPAPQVQQSFPVAKANQTITFTSSPPAQPTVGGPTYTVTATATSGLTVSFTIDASASSVCSIAGSTVSFIGNGTCVINANQPGNANYNPAPQVQQSFTVKSSQTITFTSSPPATPTVGGPTYTVTATATSGLTVTFTIDPSASSVCTIAGSTVSFIGAGTCVINANQAGNASFYPAPQVQQSFGVKNAQTITFTSTAPTNAVYQGPTYTVTATASSGLTVTFTIDASASSVCSIAGSTVSFIGTGICVINANQAGDANYYPAPQVQQSFGVGPNLAADSYGAVGNTQLVAAGHSAPTTPFSTNANSLLANDTADVAITVTAVTDAPTTGGGAITIDATGRFTYTPPLGQASGTDSYVYTGTANGVSRSATVTFNFSTIVWYVDNASGAATHDGRSNAPFLNMGTGANGLGTALSGAGPAAGAFIYVHKGSGTTVGAYTFKPNQSLVGAGATLNVPTVSPLLTIPGAAVNTPTLDNALALANGVSMVGLDMDGGSVNLAGSSVTGVSVNIGRFRRTGASAATALALGGAGNTGTFDFASVSVTGVSGSSATKGVAVSNLTGHFAVAGTDTGLSPNGGTVSGYGGRGMEFVTVANGGLTSVSLANMAITANGQTQSVPGSDTTCGGDLRLGNNLNCVSNLHLQSVNGVSLTNVSVTNSGQMGINGNAVTTLAIAGSTITGNGNGIFENGLTVQNLSGTSSITDTTVKNNAARQIYVANVANNTSLTLGITGTRTNNAYPTMDTSTTTIGNDVAGGANTQQGILFESFGGTNINMTLNIDGVVFPNNFPGNAVHIVPLAATGTLGGTTQNSSFDTNAGGVIITAQNGSGGTYNVLNSEFNRTNLQSILYSALNPTSATLQGTVQNNTIGTTGQSGSACFPTTGSGCNGIETNFIGGTGAIQLRVGGAGNGNTVQQFDGIGIRVIANGAGSLHANIENNVVTAPLGLTARGIDTNIGTTSGATVAGCLGITGNSVSGTYDDPCGGCELEIHTRVRFNATHRLPGYVGGPTDTVAAFAFISGNNGGANGLSERSNAGSYPGGAACTTP